MSGDWKPGDRVGNLGATLEDLGLGKMMESVKEAMAPVEEMRRQIAETVGGIAEIEEMRRLVGENVRGEMSVAKPLKPMMAEAYIPKPVHFADTTYDRLQKEIADFENGLAADEEVGAMMAHFGQQLTIAVESIGFRNPYLITFHGTTVPAGDRCTLIQHMGQVSLLLVALKAKDPKNARRIGFQKDADEAAKDEG